MLSLHIEIFINTSSIYKQEYKMWPDFELSQLGIQEIATNFKSLTAWNYFYMANFLIGFFAEFQAVL